VAQNVEAWGAGGRPQASGNVPAVQSEDSNLTKRASKYTWVHHGEAKLYSVGILSDGTLQNPNGYPDDVVRAAVLAADKRWHEHRSRAAKKAAATRERRRQKKVYSVARQFLSNGSIGPRPNCAICGRGLSDQPSVARGIGPECWGDILRAMEVCP
jgi:hypothetical protein